VERRRVGFEAVTEPRQQADYDDRKVEAARRVLVDVAQVLASFTDSFVLVGGWVPDLLIDDRDEPHSGSIDVDLALDSAKLAAKRYAELLHLLVATRRYAPGPKAFQFTAAVELRDGLPPIAVSVDFLASADVGLRRAKPRLVEGFRVLQAAGCGLAFRDPSPLKLRGRMISGAENVVTLRVASIPDFLVMKAHALAGRDKPKDAYDLCYCLDYAPTGYAALAAAWRVRLGAAAAGDADARSVGRALEILKEKFGSVAAYGPQQVVAFRNAVDVEERERQARRAFELVAAFVRAVEAT
jgi:predicted nucleotidyltransferase